MNRNDITKELIEVLTEIQECSGHSISEIGDDTCPMQDLEGFDSLNSMEAACMLSERLGFEVEGKVLVPDRAGQVLCVKEIVDRLSRVAQKQKGGTNGRS